MSPAPPSLVDALRGSAGADVSSCFEAVLTAVPTAGRQQRLQVRYLGGLDRSFRGKIVLGKPGEGAEQQRLPIDLVVFATKHP